MLRRLLSQRQRLASFLLFAAFIAVFAAISAAQGVAEDQKSENGVTKAKSDDLVAEIYLARDDGSGKAGDAATSFSITDIPIYCVVNLNSAEPVTVRMNLVAVDVRGVKPDTKVVTTSYTTKNSQNRVNFTGKPVGNWVAGKYRADIFVKDKLVWSRAFLIGEAAPTKPAAKPVVARKLMT